MQIPGIGLLQHYQSKIRKQGYLDRDDIELLFAQLLKFCEEDSRYFGVSSLFQRLTSVGKSQVEGLWAFAEFALKKQKFSFSKDYQDLWVLFHYERDFRGTFLELGAADGVKKSNCFLLEKEGWTGVAIEPNPILFKELIQNRTAKCIHSAITVESAADNQTKSVELWFHPDRLTAGSLYQPTNSSEFQHVQVPSLSVAQLKSLNILNQQIDYVSIDIEGGEIPIASAILAAFDVSLFSIEHNFNEDKMQNLLELFHKKGYREEFPGLARNEILFSKLNFV